MQKIVAILLTLVSWFGCASQQPDHLQRLKEFYPFGLIGDDYGILNEEDLAINTCNVTQAESFSLKGDTPYPYWKCYSIKDASLHCDDPDYDEDEKSLMVILALEIRSKKEQSHDYLTRRAIRLESCKYFQSQFIKMTKDESHICVSGEFWKKHSGETANAEMIWSFDKFKTKKGCVSYFADDCNLKVQLERGCKPKKMKE
jgi:hypothetical protein